MELFELLSKPLLVSLLVVSTVAFYFQLTLFCEGTRFTPAKHKASIQFALKNGLKPLKHHLVPRTKGFTSIVEGFRQSGEEGRLSFRLGSDKNHLCGAHKHRWQ